MSESDDNVVQLRKPILNKPKGRQWTKASARDGYAGKEAGRVKSKRLLRGNLEMHNEKLVTELQAEKAANARLKSFIHGMVKLAGGEVSLSAEYLQEWCNPGSIVITGRAPNFIVITLGDEATRKPVPVAPIAAEPEPTVLGPEAQHAYNVAYEKALAEDKLIR